MRHLVIHDRGGTHAQLPCLALIALAERVLCQVLGPRGAPLAGVTTGMGAAPAPIDFLARGLLVLRAVTAAVMHQCAAAWMPTGAWGCLHGLFAVANKKPARGGPGGFPLGAKL